MTRVKICGCTRAADAVAAAEAGADFVGIMFAESRRRVSVHEASLIARALGPPLSDLGQREPPPLHPGSYLTPEAWFAHGAQALDRLLARKRPLVVGVFQDQPLDEVNDMAGEAGIDLVQFSGNETWSDCLLSARQAIKVVHELPGMKATDVLDRVEPGAALAFMLDGSHGTGRPGDWHVARDLGSRLPFWLAGGLTPDNVGDVVQAVRPWAVDVSSGVETDGLKDARKIDAFIRAASAAVAA